MCYYQKGKITVCVMHFVLLLMLLLFSIVFRNFYSDLMGGDIDALSPCAELALSKLFLSICGIVLFAVIIFTKNTNHLIYFLIVDILWAMLVVMMMLSPTLYITVRMDGGR